MLHRTGDKLATVEQLEEWVRGRGLTEKDVRLSRSNHRKALELREALRQFLGHAPTDRRGNSVGAELNAAAANFPLIVRISAAGELELQPEPRGRSAARAGSWPTFSSPLKAAISTV
jgi:hypothetical protein